MLVSIQSPEEEVLVSTEQNHIEICSLVSGVLELVLGTSSRANC